MAKIDKLEQRIRNNCKNVAFDDLKKLLESEGFSCRQPGGGSSHYHFYIDIIDDILTIPYGRPIKVIYVKKSLSAIDLVRIKREGE